MGLEGIEELLEKLDDEKFVLIREDHKEAHYLVRKNQKDGWVRETIEKRARPAAHVFTSLEGYLSFLNSDRCTPERGIIFVGPGSVVARLKYQSVADDTATLNLEHSEEFKALLALTRGVKHKDLWRLLNTHLFAALPVELLLQISNIKVTGKREGDIQISDGGQVASSGSDSLRVVWNDSKAEGGSRIIEIGKNWVWKGRIWGAFTRNFEIGLVLEIEPEGPVFTFHAQQLETIMRNARLDLVHDIVGGLTAARAATAGLSQKDAADPGRFTVHEGTY